MTRTMPIIEARKRLTSLPEEFEKERELGAVVVTRRGKPVMALMPWELYESILETMEIMADPELMAALRRGIRDIQEGRTFSAEEVEREFGL